MRHTHHALRFLGPFLFVLLAAVSSSAQQPCSDVFTVTAQGLAFTSTCPPDPAPLDAANLAASANADLQAQSVCRLLRCGAPPATAMEAVELLACTTNQVTTQITIRATCSTSTTRGFPVPIPQEPAGMQRGFVPPTPQ
jgi:hypothetical protein